MSFDPVMPTPPQAPDDDALMRAFAQGDATAFERLYQRHRAALYRFVCRLLGPSQRPQADEVFQDTWLRVVQARASWLPQGASFRTWLFTLAHHRAVDCLRKTGREVSSDAIEAASAPDRAPWSPEGGAEAWAHWPAAPAAPGGLGADGAGAPGQDEVPDHAFWRAAGQRLLQCLDELPMAQKSVFLLHHEDGLSLPELAASLQLGFETARSRLRYAMSKLRTCMGAYLPAGAASEGGTTP